MPEALQPVESSSKAGRLGWPVFVGGLALFFALFVLISSDGRQPGVDSHYHFMMAKEIAEGNLTPSMAEDLPLTIYKDLDVDHYWGFHVLLSPFTLLPDQEMGMKVATSAMFCFVILSLFFYLRRRGIQFAWFWALVPLALTTIAWRYLHLRGAQLLVPLLLVFIASAFHQEDARKRRLSLFLCAFIGMLSYQGAIVLLTAHIAGLGAWWVLKPATFSWKRAWEPGLTAGGLAAGLTLNPYMDSSAQTWEFAGYHLFTMGVDRDGLYGRVAEFHGFAPEWFIEHLEWLAFTLAVVAGLGWLLRVRLRRMEITRDQAVGAGLAVLGILMTSMATRATEYSVIFGVLFLASLVPHTWSPEFASKLTRMLALFILLSLGWQANQTSDALNSRSILHTRMYEGAQPQLAENGESPVLNLVEADYNTLLWEYADVRCVQGLSRYFLVNNEQAYQDIQMLKHPQSPPRMKLEALHRFVEQDVSLVANHLTRINGQPTAFAVFAGSIPHMLEPIFRSKGLPNNARVGMLYRLNHERIKACLDQGDCAPRQPQ